MGYRLVDRAWHYAQLYQLSDRTTLVLVGMAHRARDEARGGQEAAIYEGGWEYLARACLRYPTYDDAAKRGVARAIRTLVEYGVVKPLGGHRIGTARRYALDLPPVLGRPGWWL